MKSLKELFRIGKGPSSSHTMGPRNAAEKYKTLYPDACKYQVTLYGSLAATGKGHLTDWAVNQVLGEEKTEIIWCPDIVLPYHPNGMKFEMSSDGIVWENSWIVYSVGGGALEEEGLNSETTPDVYDLDHLLDIMSWCEERGLSYWEYVEHCEGKEIWDYLAEVWSIMKDYI